MGWASNPANVPGFFQVYRPATVRIEHTIRGHAADVEGVTDVWEARERRAATWSCDYSLDGR